jgi:capsular polysaccharide biosynthesis protein
MMDILEFLTILKEKIKPVLVMIVLGILVGVLAYFVLTPVFETRTTFMILESKLIRRTLEGKKLDIDTYLDFVDNESLYHKIYTNLEIQKKYNMDFEEFKRSFEVTTVEDTAIIKLLVTFQDPEISFQIARMLGNSALTLNRQVIDEEVHAGYRFSEAQVQGASNQLETARNELDNFFSQHPLPKMAMEIDGLRNRITIEETGELAVSPPLESTSLNRGINPQIIGMTPTAFNSLARIQAEITETEARLAVAKADNRKFDAERHLKELTVQLKQKNKILSQLKSRLFELTTSYYPLKFQYEALASEFESAQKGYEKIYQTGLESRIEVIGKTKEMTIIDQPVKPQKQAFPKLIITLIAGLFLGLLAAFAYVSTVAFSRKLQDV